MAAALMTGKVGDTYLSSKNDESPGLANRDPSLEPSDSCSDDEFNNNPKSDKDDRIIGGQVLLSGNDHPHATMA